MKLELSEEEIIDLVRVIGKEYESQIWEKVDTVLYGGDAQKAGACERSMQRVWNAIPDHIRMELTRREKLEEAAKLRARAEALENSANES